MKKQQSGFTLIELVVVIIILGILAATALPRFTDMQVRARIAKLNGALGAVRSAAALAHSQCLVQAPGIACPSSGAAAINMDGLNITGINQYPTANAAGIIAAAGLSTANPAEYATAGGGVGAGNTITIAVPGGTGIPGASNCEFTYTAATLSGTNVVAPTVSSTAAASTCT